MPSLSLWDSHPWGPWRLCHSGMLGAPAAGQGVGQVPSIMAPRHRLGGVLGSLKDRLWLVSPCYNKCSSQYWKKKKKKAVHSLSVGKQNFPTVFKQVWRDSSLNVKITYKHLEFRILFWPYFLLPIWISTMPFPLSFHFFCIINCLLQWQQQHLWRYHCTI